MSEPLVLAGPWRQVMVAAGWRCECTGQCGQPHKSGEGRCTHAHDAYASKHKAPVQLLAAPTDPALPVTHAAQLPLTGLAAWCPGCWDGARRAARRTARARPSPDQTLFDL